MPRRRGRTAKLGCVYARRGVWYIRFKLNGRQYRESSRSTDREVALALLERRRNEVVEGKMLGPRRREVRFDDLVALIEADYRNNGRKSATSMRFRLRHLKRAFGSTPAGEITNRVLKGYVTRRLDEKAAAATVQYELKLLGRMFTLAVEADMVRSRPPMPTVIVRNARRGFFEPDEVEAVLRRLPPDVAPAIEFAYITGWRIGEIRKLTVFRHIDYDVQLVRLAPEETKGGEGRTFPFRVHERLQSLIVEQVTKSLDRSSVWLFSRADGSPLGEFKKAWRTACKAAGCQGKLVHDLRRTAVRNLVRAGVSEHTAMALTGHRTRHVFDRYDIVNEADLTAAVQKLVKRRSGA